MAKLAFHPNAYLSETRNIKQGLVTRTTILRILERNVATANMLVEESKLKYAVVLHHMRLLKAEGIVSCKAEKKPYFWELTGMGQKRLIEP